MKEAVEYLDSVGINVSLALAINGHPHNNALSKNGFIDSRMPINLYILSLDDKLNTDSLKRIKPSEIYLLMVT